MTSLAHKACALRLNNVARAGSRSDRLSTKVDAEETLPDFTLNPEVKLGDLLTSISVLVATAALVTTWLRDRIMRQREYSDRIRDATARTIVALRRRRSLANRLFDEIEPYVTEADTKLVAGTSPVAVRDEFWQKLVQTRAALLKELFEEKLEDAYVGLLGYDSAVQDLFLSALAALDELDQRAYVKLLVSTQQDILAFEDRQDPPQTAELGNLLRATLRRVQEESAEETERVVNECQNKLLRLVTASDRAILKRKISLESL